MKKTETEEKSGWGERKQREGDKNGEGIDRVMGNPWEHACLDRENEIREMSGE